MHGAISGGKKYEDDINLQYYDTDKQLCEDQIWVYENSERILELLKECDGEISFKAKLKETFDLTDYQIRKLSQMRLDMLTKEEYEVTKEKLKIRKAAATSNNNRGLYCNSQKKKIAREIQKINAYFTVAAKLDVFMELITEARTDEELKNLLQEKFELDIGYANELKHLSLVDFSPKEKERKLQNLKRLENEYKYYCEELNQMDSGDEQNL